MGSDLIGVSEALRMQNVIGTDGLKKMEWKGASGFL
jgi:hypothetical protein